MRNTLLSRRRHHERGQTILLVAISIVSLLAMAALAIDIVTLYVARSEIQRAADADALVAAKAIADSGVTSLQATDPNLTAAQTLAQNMATAAVTGLISAPNINLVAGQPASMTTLAPVINWARQGNPYVTVNLQRTGLPTFFSKVWLSAAPSVTASATAEVYNPSNLPIITPIAPKSVKPWLVANADPIQSQPFINTLNGTVETNIIGETFNLTADCQVGLPTCQLFTLPTNRNPPIANAASQQVDYVPAAVTPANPKNVCPASCAGSTDYEQTIECADANSYSTLACGGGAANATWDNNNNPGGGTGLSASGAECLTGASTSGPAQGQDLLTNSGIWPATPFQIQAGTHNPLHGSFVTTSNSVVTIPIINNNYPPGNFPTSGQPLTIVGYLQAFINQVQSGITPNTTAGDINITVLNIAGCSSVNNSANPVIGGGGSSPVPVRLITPP
jgi:Flp pilus assembly protein TadG